MTTSSQKNHKKLPELLAPAGSPLALQAAVEGGADAVYLGMSAFNARIHAQNFDTETLRESIRLAHAYGTKVYVALNTLVFDRELSDFLRTAEEAYLCGADALIVADVGGASAIRARIPIDLHASTQMAGHNAEAAKTLASLGFSRMVCAREMGREELALFVRNSPIEAEVFVHGALCVSHSGQCLFSSLVGGRSGNRGECAQPCRLPYRARNGKTAYPLSLKDISLSRHVPELIDMGIASFKIEGRMKSPEYVRDVTRIWRRLLDERRGADDREMAELSAIFSRGGFTDGYYTGRIGKAMLGVRSEEDKQITRERAPFEKMTRKIPLSCEAVIRRGEPMSLTERGRGITVRGIVPEDARTAPTDGETVRRCLGKMGGTPYEMAELDLSLDAGLMIPISALNALRRSLVDAMATESERSADDFYDAPTKGFSARSDAPMGASANGGAKKITRTAVFYRPDEIPPEAKSFFDILYVPIESYEGQTNGVLLPPVIMESECARMRDALARAKSLGAEHVLVGNVGHLSLAKESGLSVHGDFRLNVANARSAEGYGSLGLADVISSPELTLPQLKDISQNVSAIVYGKVPLMVTEKCIGKEIADCNACKANPLSLVDRRGVTFPVLRTFEHRSLIFNSVPIYMADREESLSRANVTHRHFIFSDEDKKQISGIIAAHKRALPPDGAVRRIK